VFKDVLGCAAVRRELAGNTQNLPTLSNVVLQILVRTYAYMRVCVCGWGGGGGGEYIGRGMGQGWVCRWV